MAKLAKKATIKEAHEFLESEGYTPINKKKTEWTLRNWWAEIVPGACSGFLITRYPNFS